MVFAVLFVSGCGSSPEDQILGKWEAGETGFQAHSVEFASDGKAKLTMFGKRLQGTYKLNGDELCCTSTGKTTKSKAKVGTVTEMELSSQGNTIKYKKV